MSLPSNAAQCDCSTRSRSSACGFGKLCEIEAPVPSSTAPREGSAGLLVSRSSGSSGSGSSDSGVRSGGGSSGGGGSVASDLPDLRKRVALLEAELQQAKQQLQDKRKERTSNA